ncbi:MAG: hypothetical protein DME77_07920 [Verrucomicrobia bacterium]|nr:MAG: hypothetical protein DME77_07920 [Verrucomicrobiota bacterium]
MPIGKNGTSLAELLIPQALTNAAAPFVDLLKINSISEDVRRGRRIVLKRRNVYSEPLAGLANLYFRVSNIPIRRRYGGDCRIEKSTRGSERARLDLVGRSHKPC